MYIKEAHLKERSGTVNLDRMVTTHQWYDPVGPVSPYILSETTLMEHAERANFTGWDIPDYHSRRKRGELLPFTPWRRYDSIGASTGEYSFVTTGGSSYWYAENFPRYDYWLLTEDRMQAYAPSSYDAYVTEAAANIYGQGWDALTFIAEFADVKRQFIDVAKKLRYVVLPKRPPKFHWRKYWKKFTSEWLSVRYGWRPLLYDLEDLNTAIKTLREEQEVKRYSEHSGTKYTTMHYETAENQWSYFKVFHVITTKVTTRIRGTVAADIEVPALQFNPLQTGWEIIPFSFVLDWFLRVGQTLSAISFLAREKAYTASKGFRLEVERDYTAESGDYTSSFGSGLGFEQTGSSRATLEVRTPCPIPYHPHFVLKINNLKVIDLVALILQRL